MKIKTSELIGPALDWAVAKALGVTPVIVYGSDAKIPHIFDADLLEMEVDSGAGFYPTTDWGLAGSIIDREKLCVGYQHQCDPVYVPLLDPATICWARTTAGGYLKYGPTPLIAAMRCLIASKLGDEVDVPEELLCTP